MAESRHEPAREVLPGWLFPCPSGLLDSDGVYRAAVGRVESPGLFPRCPGLAPHLRPSPPDFKHRRHSRRAHSAADASGSVHADCHRAPPLFPERSSGLISSIVIHQGGFSKSFSFLLKLFPAKSVFLKETPSDFGGICFCFTIYFSGGLCYPEEDYVDHLPAADGGTT